MSSLLVFVGFGGGCLDCCFFFVGVPGFLDEPIVIDCVVFNVLGVGVLICCLEKM